MWGVVSVCSYFVWWYFQNALTHDLSHESEFEALVIMCFAIYRIMSSLGNTFATNLCYFENINVCLQSRLGQEEAAEVEESYLSLSGATITIYNKNKISVLGSVDTER